LFTADQNLNGDTPKYTRQNANGNRRGYEVPEERDYYPYWAPSPFNDIVIMVSDKVTEKLMKEYVNSPDHSKKGNLALTLYREKVFFFIISRFKLGKAITFPEARDEEEEREFYFPSLFEFQSAWSRDGAVVRTLTSHQCGFGFSSLH